MTESDISYFLITYDVMRELAEVEEFGPDHEKALKAYAEQEEVHRHDPAFEVVLLGADSRETIEKTHSSYFIRDEHGFGDAIKRAIDRNERAPFPTGYVTL